MSHFSNDHSIDTEFKISQHIDDIEVRVTGGELEALLLESRLIKQLQPLYNRQLRRTKKLTVARRKVDEDGYFRVDLEDIDTIDPATLDSIMGVFQTRGKAKSALLEISRTYGLCPRYLSLEKGDGPCFSYQIHKCRGACIAMQDADEFNSTLLDVMARQRLESWPFKSPVIVNESTPEADMKSIVIDQWCVIADISQPEHCSSSIRFYDKVFDIDTYRILRSYMNANRHRLTIRPITHAALAEMV